MRRSKQKGITLIALVITIIVLLILAGVSIATLTGENGILTKANEAKEATEQAKQDELAMLNDLNNLMGNYVESEQGFDGEVNSPKLSSGMIPVKYEDGKWLKADESNTNNSWYDYGADSKKWANIVTVKEEVRDSYTNAAENTEINMDDVTTMFVWIPRYSYSISYTDSGNKKAGGKIEVSFLRGNTNKEANGVETAKIVHPGFEMNGVPLQGIWVAKFEASGVNENGENVGNRTNGSTSLPNTTGAYVTVKPSVTSWRDITIGESQYQSMKISTDTEHYGMNGVNSHLIKNAEWGAVAYLCYSDYGVVPQINACGSYNSTTGYYYDFYTGAGPQANGNDVRYPYDSSTFLTNVAYNTTNGNLASTTGNETGVYDMNGGAWERVAAYLDNKNKYLATYGYSTTDNNIKYFNSDNELNSQYSAYWERYDVSDEERNDQIKISDTETLTQDQLWDATKQDVKYQEARLRLTKANFDLMAKHKGIGINEVTDEFSYYGAYNNGTTNTWNWFTTVDQPANREVTYGRAWDSDYVLIGHAAEPFVYRGGYCSNRAGAGVFSSLVTNGNPYSNNSFRPVLAF